MQYNIPDSREFESSAQQNSSSGTLPQIDLLRLHTDLSRILDRDISPENAIADGLQLIISLINACGAVFFQSTEENLKTIAQRNSKQLLSWDSEIHLRMKQQAEETLIRDRVQIVPLELKPEIILLTVPARLKCDSFLLSIALFKGGQKLEPFIAILQVAASLFATRLDSQQHPPSRYSPAQLVIPSLSLSGEEHAFHLLAREIQKFAGADIIGVGEQVRSNKIRLAGISGTLHPDRRTALSRSIEEVLYETVAHGLPLAHGNIKSELQSSPSSQLEEIASTLKINHALCYPLPSNNQGWAGALFMAWNNNEHIPSGFDRDLTESATLLGSTLRAITPKQSQRFSRFFKKNKPSASIAFMLLCLIAIFVPVPHHITGQCVVQPVTRRFVVSQFDGILKQALVKPGDMVTKGTLLASMDGRDLETETAGLVAERDKALKIRDIRIASGDSAGAQIALLEHQQIQKRIELLQRHSNELKILSPLDGIILSEDLERAEGSPLTKGQPLFEIAPVNDMLLELEFDQGTIEFLEPGLPVNAVFTAYPSRKWIGHIETIRPTSEIRDGRNVFVCETTIENPNGILRPGLKGEASAIGPAKPLIWIIFHRPWRIFLTFFKTRFL